MRGRKWRKWRKWEEVEEGVLGEATAPNRVAPPSAALKLPLTGVPGWYVGQGTVGQVTVGQVT
jgi:hypothetical protein